MLTTAGLDQAAHPLHCIPLALSPSLCLRFSPSLSTYLLFSLSLRMSIVFAPLSLPFSPYPLPLSPDQGLPDSSSPVTAHRLTSSPPLAGESRPALPPSHSPCPAGPAARPQTYPPFHCCTANTLIEGARMSPAVPFPGFTAEVGEQRDPQSASTRTAGLAVATGAVSFVPFV